MTDTDTGVNYRAINAPTDAGVNYRAINAAAETGARLLEKPAGTGSVEVGIDEAASSSDGSQTHRRADSGKSSKPRLKLFKKVMEKSLQWMIDNASFDRFSSYFHPLSKQNPQLTEAMHKQFISQLQTLVQKEIVSVIEEGELQMKLEELDKLEQQAEDTSQSAWRPSGIPEKDVCSDLVTYYRKQEEYIRLQLKRLQKENAALAYKVQAGREAITHTEELIATAVDEWRGSLEDLEAFVLTHPPSDSL